MSQKRASQNREAPAYQEYAAAWMAKLSYRTWSLAERGLAWTMRNECWANDKLPGRHDLLAKVLGVTEQEIDDYLPAVMVVFDISDGFIFSPELRDYRKYLDDIKEAKITGGKKGADITNNKKKLHKNRMDNDDTANPSGNPSPMPSGESQVSRRVKSGSLVQSSTVKQSQVQSLVKEPIHDQWISAYEAASNESVAAPKIVRRTV